MKKITASAKAAEPNSETTGEWGELPQAGGCFVRNPDGSLVRDTDFHGPDIADPETAEKEA